MLAVVLACATLAVNHKLQRASGELLFRETKTAASDDTMPVPPIVVAALEERRRYQLADRKEADLAWLPIDPRNFNRSWDNRVARSGVRKITVHDGRRSCGTLLFDLDVHPRVIMRILRHAQFSMTTEIYLEEDAGNAQAPGRVAPLLHFAAIRSAKRAVHSTEDGP
ncbi:tyrosine-type recombinase/integrase [Amycolatopsis sp. lyj-23]|uniref:tyrosine-type recombinase/integrase n=1 Tax=Amycolatopsis sp. lyj-23 TaxID=2789283 RepID=UPI003978B406